MGSDLEKSFNLTFTKIYISSPKLLIAINNYHYCPNDTTHYFKLLSSAVISGGYKIRVAIMNYLISYDPNYYIRMGYLIVHSQNTKF